MTEEFKKLSEGYDFLEESCVSPTPLIFSEETEISINESSGTKSPYKILGKACGVFQEVGGFSRNNRYYPPEHWPRLLEDLNVQERIKGRKMLGMIGHENSRISDFQLREGLVSHVISKLEIREDENSKPYLYGELEILDTPAGRILKGLYEGGVGLHVSSRGAGKLLDTPGKPYKTVAPQFFLEGFDIVLNPGFLAAKPVYEAIPTNSQLSEAHDDYVNNPAKWVKEPNAECQYRKEKWEEANKKHSDLKQNDLAGKNPETQAAYKEAIQAYKDLEKARKDHYPNYKTLQDIEGASEDLATLKLQVEQLAQIMEKVVDSIYEQPSEAEQPVEESTEAEPNKAESLAECISLLAEANIDEEAFEQVLEIIRKGMN